jgi:cell division protease FtsH
MARRMVTRFGMSDVVGLMAVGDSDQEVFLGRDVMQRRDVSEHTAQLVDQEVKRILDEAHARAREVLEAERDLLTRIAEALLQVETLDRDDVLRPGAGTRSRPGGGLQRTGGARLSGRRRGARRTADGEGRGPDASDGGRRTLADPRSGREQTARRAMVAPMQLRSPDQLRRRPRIPSRTHEADEPRQGLRCPGE